MTWLDALEIVVARTGHERFRVLCSDDNLDAESRENYRALIVRMATGQPEPATNSQEVIPGLGSLADLPGPDKIEPGCRPCH